MSSLRNARGPKPDLSHEPTLLIDAPQDTTGLATWLGELEHDGLSILFGAGPGPHPHDSRNEICHLDGAGLGLPDRDYYFKYVWARVRDVRSGTCSHAVPGTLIGR